MSTVPEDDGFTRNGHNVPSLVAKDIIQGTPRVSMRREDSFRNISVELRSQHNSRVSFIHVPDGSTVIGANVREVVMEEFG